VGDSADMLGHAASFFAKTILPAISATRAVVENVDTDLMDLVDDAF